MSFVLYILLLLKSSTGIASLRFKRSTFIFGGSYERFDICYGLILRDLYLFFHHWADYGLQKQQRKRGGEKNFDQ